VSSHRPSVEEWRCYTWKHIYLGCLAVLSFEISRTSRTQGHKHIRQIPGPLVHRDAMDHLSYDSQQWCLEPEQQAEWEVVEVSTSNVSSKWELVLT
jgi:hypothetical protein